MPNYQAITQATHGTQRWLPTTSFAFAMRDAVLPLSLAELSRAMISLPIAFVEQNGSFVPVAVMSLQPAQNLCVTADGRWIHGYIPASCRCYPFRYLNTPEGKPVLCVDADSGLIDEEGSSGEPFFDADGRPSAALQEMLLLLNQMEQGKAVSAAACTVLKQHHLIVPWPISVKTDSGEKQIAGLYQIDNGALSQLSAEALLAVRDAGGLLIAYCQLLSMQHLPVLGQLADAHAKAAALAVAALAEQAAQMGSLDLDFLAKDDTISFSGYR